MCPSTWTASPIYVPYDGYPDLSRFNTYDKVEHKLLFGKPADGSEGLVKETFNRLLMVEKMLSCENFVMPVMA